MDRRLKDSSCWLLLRPPETQVQGGHDEQIQQGRRDQPSQDDDGQRVLDLVPGDIAGDHQGNDRQTASQRGHENRREPFAGCRSAYSPSTSARYPSGNLTSLRRRWTSATTEPRSRPRTLAPTSCRRERPSCSMLSGVGFTLTSATSSRRT